MEPDVLRRFATLAGRDTPACSRISKTRPGGRGIVYQRVLPAGDRLANDEFMDHNM
jgi:hypothetical protein